MDIDFANLIQNFGVKNIVYFDEKVYCRVFCQTKCWIRYHGSKHSKERVTVFLCCNINRSEKVLPIPISEITKKSQYLKNVQKLLCS